MTVLKALVDRFSANDRKLPAASGGSQHTGNEHLSAGGEMLRRSARMGCVLLTSTSMRPNVFSALSTAASTCSTLRTSICTAKHFLPVAFSNQSAASVLAPASNTQIKRREVGA
jgi:hypothetical protein